MKTLVRNVVLSLIMSFLTQPAWSVSPCDNVDRSLTDTSKTVLAPVIASQLHAKKVDVLQSYRFDGWTILYVNSHDSDETFLLSPTTRSITVTSQCGVVPRHGMRSKASESGHSKTLQVSLGSWLSCFAWHVTSDRDQ